MQIKCRSRVLRLLPVQTGAEVEAGTARFYNPSVTPATMK